MRHYRGGEDDAEQDIASYMREMRKKNIEDNVSHINTRILDFDNNRPAVKALIQNTEAKENELRKQTVKKQQDLDALETKYRKQGSLQKFMDSNGYYKQLTTLRTEKKQLSEELSETIKIMNMDSDSRSTLLGQLSYVIGLINDYNSTNKENEEYIDELATFKSKRAELLKEIHE
jgi:hypothetical protein